MFTGVGLWELSLRAYEGLMKLCDFCPIPEFKFRLCTLAFNRVRLSKTWKGWIMCVKTSPITIKGNLILHLNVFISDSGTFEKSYSMIYDFFTFITRKVSEKGKKKGSVIIHMSTPFLSLQSFLLITASCPTIGWLPCGADWWHTHTLFSAAALRHKS